MYRRMSENETKNRSKLVGTAINYVDTLKGVKQEVTPQDAVSNEIIVAKVFSLYLRGKRGALLEERTN